METPSPKNQSREPEQFDERRLQWIQRIGLLATLATVGVAAWQLPHFLSGNSTIWPQYANAFVDVLVAQSYTLVVLLLLTALTRTVSLRTVVLYWFVGVFGVHTLLVAIGQPFLASYGVTTVGIWIAPLNQTVIEAAVVVIFYLLATRNRGTHPTISDGLLVGFAVGAGVGFHEDMTYQRASPVGIGAEYGTAGGAGSPIWWSYLFPAIGWFAFFNIRQFGRGDVGLFGLDHAGWGALLGVGVGTAFVHRHHVFAWVVGITTLLVSYITHLSHNWFINNPSVAPPVVGNLFVGGDVDGANELSVYLLLGAIAAGVFLDLVLLRRFGAVVEDVPSVHAGLRTSQSNPSSRESGQRGPLGRITTLDRYARSRRAAIVGLYRRMAGGRPLGPLGSTLSDLDTAARGSIFGLFSGLAIGIVLLAVAGSDVAIARTTSSSSLTACAPCAPADRMMDWIPAVLGAVASAVGAGVSSLASAGTAVVIPAAHAGVRDPESDSETGLVDPSTLSSGELRTLVSGAKHSYIYEGTKTEYRTEYRNGFPYLVSKQVADPQRTLTTERGVLKVDRFYIVDGRLTAEIGGVPYPLHPDAKLRSWGTGKDFRQLYPSTKSYEQTQAEAFEASRRATTNFFENHDERGAMTFTRSQRRDFFPLARDLLDVGQNIGGFPDLQKETMSKTVKAPIPSVWKLLDWIRIDEIGSKTREKYKLTDPDAEAGKDDDTDDE